jgi:DNA adenine methylase
MLLPFLKWPGGKRWAAKHIAEIISPNLKGTYFEPFLGSGAVFFALGPSNAVLSDVNAELINIYKAVKKQPEDICKKIKKLKVSKDNYYRIRSARPKLELDSAARFLYLNRTAFGGIYRLNQKGEFNVPYGGGERTPAILWERDLLINASKALKKVKVLQKDFEAILDSASSDDVVYCDPTYTVTHDANGFIRYNENNFSWHDQERLAAAAERAMKRGALVLISNAHHWSVKELYKKHKAKIYVLSRRSQVSRDPKKRRLVFEYFFVFEPKKNPITKSPEFKNLIQKSIFIPE